MIKVRKHWKNMVGILVGFVIIFSLLVENRAKLPFIVGVRNEVKLPDHSVRMAAGWHPYLLSSSGQSVSFVEEHLLSSAENGQIHFQFLSAIDPRYLAQLKSPRGEPHVYSWGTAYPVDQLPFARSSQANNSRQIYFVPKHKLIISVLYEKDLDQIQNIY